MLYELDQIKPMRIKLGISQKRLAKECEISASMLNQIENHVTQPSYKTAKKIFQYLEKMKWQDQKKAGEICAKPVFTLKPTDTVRDAVKEMRRRQISQIPVFSGTQCKGMITEDGITALIDSESFDKATRLQRILESTPPMVPSDYPATPLTSMIRFSKCVLVTEDGTLVGIITAQDLHKLLQ